jgi:hypothetical protein
LIPIGMTILCLCREQHHWKLIPGYADAFRRLGIEVLCVDDAIPFDISLDELLQRYPRNISAIFHFESAHPLFPVSLERSAVPTVCFHPDTYAFTERRIEWSTVFDHVAVFHPGYVERFTASGHPGAFLLPHAVRPELFEGPPPQREFDVGWVGQTSGKFYKARAQWLPRLALAFRTNDWSRSYTIAEVADVYRRSRIVVNIGRDDFPQDANLRAFEVLASGALLVTALPTELSALGFHDGVHFVGYREGDDLVGLLRNLLNDEDRRAAIAAAARTVVLKEHTYDRRAAEILTRLERNAGKGLAPARSWPAWRARLAALDFYAAHGLTKCAARQFRHVAGHGFRETIRGASLLGRSWVKSLRTS